MTKTDAQYNADMKAKEAISDNVLNALHYQSRLLSMSRSAYSLGMNSLGDDLLKIGNAVYKSAKNAQGAFAYALNIRANPHKFKDEQ